MEGTLVLRKSLDYETLPAFSVGLRAQDHGNPPRSSDTVLHVNVIDADDQNPRFFDDRYTAILPNPPIKVSKRNFKSLQLLQVLSLLFFLPLLTSLTSC